MTKVPENIVERIKKMLALAEDTAASPNEAATAAKMAENLMRKYNLEHADVIQDELAKGGAIVREFAIDDFDHTASRYPVWMNILAVAVANLFECHADMAHTYKFSGSKPCVNIRFIGYKTDVEVARWTFSYLINQISRLCDKWWETFQKSEEYRPWFTAKTSKKSYREGAGQELIDKINAMVASREQEMKQSVTGTALVVSKKKAIEAEFGDFKYTEKKSEGEFHPDAYRSGRKDAKNINIFSPVAGQTETQLKLR